MRSAAPSPTHRILVRAYARVAAPPTMQSTHSQLHRAAYALFCVITFVVRHHLSPLSLPFAVIATDRAHRTPYTYAVLLLPARNSTNPFIRIRIANRRVPLSSFRTLCARHIAISPQKPAHARFCRRHCRPTPCFASFGSLYSRKRCRGAHFFTFSFHVEHASCHPPKPQCLSAILSVYAYLCIAFLHDFAYAFAS